MNHNLIEPTYTPEADDVSRPEDIVNADKFSVRGAEDIQEDDGPLATAVDGNVPLDEVEKKRAKDEAESVTENGDTAGLFATELDKAAPGVTSSIYPTEVGSSEVADLEATVDAMVVRRDPTNIEHGEVETGVIDNPVEVDEAADKLHAAADAIEDAEDGDDIAAQDKKLATAKANLVVALDETDAYASDEEDGDTVSDHGFGIGYIAGKAVAESEGERSNLLICRDVTDMTSEPGLTRRHTARRSGPVQNGERGHRHALGRRSPDHDHIADEF